MKHESESNQIGAIFSRTGHSVWHQDWKLIVSAFILLIFDAAVSGWKSGKSGRRTRRY
jgi:hypothetical protein